MSIEEVGVVELEEKEDKRSFTLLYIATFIFRIAFGATILLIDTYLIYLYYAHYAALHGVLPAPDDPNLIFILVIVALTYYLSESMSAGVIGFLNDHRDVRHILVLSAYVGAIAMASYSLGLFLEPIIWYDVALFALAHIIHGIGSAMKVTSTVTYITRKTRFENRGRFMGLYDFTLFLGRVTGIGLAGYLWGYFATTETIDSIYDHVVKHELSVSEALSLIRSGLHAFWVLSFFLIIAGLLLLKVSPLPPQVKREKYSILDLAKAPLKEFIVMFKERKDLAIPWFAMSSLFGLVLLWGPRVLQIDIGVSGEFSGYISAYIGLLLGLPAPLWGFVSDRIGRKKTIIIGISGLILLVILIAVAVTVLQINTTDPIFYILMSPAVIFLAALGPSFLARLGDTSETGKHGEVMGGYQFTLALGEINGIITGAIAITITSSLLVDTAYYRLSGLIGIGVLAIIYFIIMVLGAFKMKPDEVVVGVKSGDGNKS